MRIHEDALNHVKANAPAGDVSAMLAALDDYGINHEFLMNVGPEKGRYFKKKFATCPPVLRCWNAVVFAATPAF